MGLYIVDRACISPPAEDPTFYKWLLEICSSEQIHAVLSGVEPVLKILSEKKAELLDKTGAVCIVSDPYQLALGTDKLLTCRWLEKHGYRFPRYAALDDKETVMKLVDECGYPLIAKHRFGRGSQGIIDVHNDGDLKNVCAMDDYVIQERVGEIDSEYTAGCFCDRYGLVRGVIVMRRELMHGTTSWAEVGEFPEIREEAQRIADKLKPRGPCNIQLRISPKGPVCFEINVRFSGTTPIRARLGFNEVEAALRHYVLREPIQNFPVINEGVVIRYWNELYVSPEAVSSLRKTGRLNMPGEHDYLIEDFGMKK
jgi:carbamoyl-phosphate synthase large subunit